MQNKAGPVNHRIRRAAQSESALLSDLGRRSFGDAFGRYNNPTDLQAYLDAAFDPALIQKNLNDPDVVYLIASSLNGDVGYAELVKGKPAPQITSGSQVQLERIYVLGAAVGTGAGRDLMLKCIEVACGMHATHLWLGVWQENSVAISFYHKFGFRIIGEKQFIIGNTVNNDYVMCLELHPAS